MREDVTWERPVIEHNRDTKWGWRVLYPEGLVLGERVDIGYGTLLHARYGLKIGDDVQIGSHCAIYTDDSETPRHGPVFIGKGAKIGTHCSIFPGVSIGDGAIIGAHSMVTCNVPAGETWFGVPAKEKMLRMWRRFLGHGSV